MPAEIRGTEGGEHVEGEPVKTKEGENRGDEEVENKVWDGRRVRGEGAQIKPSLSELKKVRWSVCYV